ncbi:hypothetical protein VCUG_01281 [Vavraia culicis subsp. floridensis]|uniref:Uncharacterized protein n=1 Tax=Vavraia culicis (isolate floridensis) TaxID=948595 RepID=L2GU34_VAVCU|nr:uncharacterized protein VCUG_01281 [Vavraia culicis subsp. floridensis]ELA47181.1 hypothetical protein VCUG_01281 [Vavraia culicis subsp. floridensis]
MFNENTIASLLTSLEQLTTQPTHSKHDLKRLKYTKIALAVLSKQLKGPLNTSLQAHLKKYISLPVHTDSTVIKVNNDLVLEEMKRYAKKLKTKAIEFDGCLEKDKAHVERLQMGMVYNVNRTDENVKGAGERTMECGGWFVGSFVVFVVVYVVVRML